MKREEALRIIKECKEKGFKHTFYTLNEYHTALDIAIKALEQEPCEDAISRQAAIVALDDRMLNLENVDMQIAMGFAKGIINDLPPVNPQPKTGHWIKIKPYPLQMHDYECSECLHETDDPTENYCNECGAKMVEPQERNDKE